MSKIRRRLQRVNDLLEQARRGLERLKVPPPMAAHPGLLRSSRATLQTYLDCLVEGIELRPTEAEVISAIDDIWLSALERSKEDSALFIRLLYDCSQMADSESVRYAALSKLEEARGRGRGALIEALARHDQEERKVDKLLAMARTALDDFKPRD